MKKIVGIIVSIFLITSVLPVLIAKENSATDTPLQEKGDLYEAVWDTENSMSSAEQNTHTLMLDEVDQENTGASSWWEVGPGPPGSLAQSFQPTLSTITKVELLLKPVGSSPYELEYGLYIVKIRKGSPTGDTIALKGFDRSAFTTNQWYTFDFTDWPVDVGDTYFIVLHGSSPTGDSDELAWGYNTGNQYTSGDAWVYLTGSWMKISANNNDFCFKTYGEGGGTNNPPNTPSTPIGPSSGTEGALYEYRTTAYDPDGDQVQVRFDWDGSYSSWSPLASSGTTFITDHSWSTAGTYHVKAQAKDEHGETSGWSSALTVTIGGSNNPPDTPSIPSGPSSGATGNSYSYSTAATDPDGDQVKYYFDWGDGSGEWTSLSASGDTGSASHSWTADGTYDVKAKAQDEYGAESGWSTVLTVTISANTAPDKPERPSGTTSGRAGTSYTYTSSATDPDGDQVYLLFDWADGTNSGWLGPYNSGDTVSASHIWSAQGSYAVKVKAKDTSDVESIWSDPLAVSMPYARQTLLELIIEYFVQLFRIT